MNDTTVLHHTSQQSYISHIEAENLDRIMSIVKQLDPMHPKCTLSICIPAYHESCLLRNTLENYTLHQKNPDNTPVDPDLYEINILINSPTKNCPRDTETRSVIESFCRDFPAYHIHISEITYDFPEKAIMGTIYKDIADAAIVRNLARDVSDEQKSELIIRTAGADVEALNPFLISRTLELFRNKDIVAHRGETRLPPRLLQAFPLLHVMQTFAIFLLRQYRGSETTNGPFSYTADIYAAVNGFNPDLKIGEEVDLANKIYLSTKNTGKVFFCDTIKDVLNNPRRQVHALFCGIGMAGRYKNFGNSQNEDTVHTMSTSWRNICPETLPESCILNCENLSREISGYYRTYLRIAKAQKIPLETIDVIFRRGFQLCGITEYSTHKSSFMYDNHIVIDDISALLQHLESLDFSWSEIFNHYTIENNPTYN